MPFGFWLGLAMTSTDMRLDGRKKEKSGIYSFFPLTPNHGSGKGNTFQWPQLLLVTLFHSSISNQTLVLFSSSCFIWPRGGNDFPLLLVPEHHFLFLHTSSFNSSQINPLSVPPVFCQNKKAKSCLKPGVIFIESGAFFPIM